MNAFSARRVRQLRPQRAAISMPASVVTMSAYQFPDIADISQFGAKLKGLPLPPKGTTALMKFGDLEVLCRVMWAEGDECGVRFDEPLKLAILKQIQLDGTVELTRCASASSTV